MIVVPSVTDTFPLVSNELADGKKRRGRGVSLMGLRVQLEIVHYAIGSFFFAGHLDVGLRTICFLNTFLFYATLR